MAFEVHRVTAVAAVIALVLAGAASASPAPARAASHAVSIGDGFFGPASLSVAVGDTVTWTNVDDSPHTVTDGGGAFDSGNLDPGATFSFTFSEPGTYTYVCQYHDEMVATITVAPASAEAPEAATAPPQQAGGAAGTPSPAPGGATAGHGAGHDDQPDTALFAPAGRAPWIAPMLIALGLIGVAAGLLPRPRASRASARPAGGWRR